MEARGQKRMNRGTRRKELGALRAVLAGPPLAWSEGGWQRLYDRVLVDADCTHDGSSRHLSKVAGLDASMCVYAGMGMGLAWHT